MNRRVAILMLMSTVFACNGGHNAASPKQQHAEMRTIDDVAPQTTVSDPPPMLTDEGPPIRPKSQPGAFADAAAPLTEKDQELRALLPFAPAIAMDPINGSKVSIRADTPTVEYKNHIYYFSSEENRREFQSGPEQFLKGSFARL